MSIGIYMDVHVKRAVTDELRRRNVDVLTAQEDGTAELSDTELLSRATYLKRVLFSQDEDLLADATQRQHANQYFCGLIYSHQLAITIGQAVHDIELIAKVYEFSDIENHIEYLPL